MQVDSQRLMPITKMIHQLLVVIQVFFLGGLACPFIKAEEMEDLSIQVRGEVLIGDEKRLLVTLGNSGDRLIVVSEYYLRIVSDQMVVAEKSTAKAWPNYSVIPSDPNDFKSHFGIAPGDKVTVTMPPPASTLFSELELDEEVVFKHRLIKKEKVFKITRNGPDEDYVIKEVRTVIRAGP